jgi:hypothetical protein
LTGKTPFNTIQAIVQRDARFTKIGLGVYALTEFLNKLPSVSIIKTKEQEEEKSHSSTEGMLLEIGNMESYDTFSPDKSKNFDNKALKQIMTLEECPNFTRIEIVREAKSIDVLWFNRRGFPDFAFEVVLTPSLFESALIRLSNLRDFNTKFFIISKIAYEEKYLKELNNDVFYDIKHKCKYKTLDQVRLFYNASLEKQKTSEIFYG